jgi:hypothetical protein
MPQLAGGRGHRTARPGTAVRSRQPHDGPGQDSQRREQHHTHGRCDAVTLGRRLFRLHMQLNRPEAQHGHGPPRVDVCGQPYRRQVQGLVHAGGRQRPRRGVDRSVPGQLDRGFELSSRSAGLLSASDCSCPCSRFVHAKLASSPRRHEPGTSCDLFFPGGERFSDSVLGPKRATASANETGPPIRIVDEAIESTARDRRCIHRRCKIQVRSLCSPGWIFQD